jgi:hypothetical protein
MSVDYDVSQSFKRIENELIDSMLRNFKRHRVDEAKEGFTWEQWQVLQLKELEKYRLANPKKFQGDFSEINKRVEGALKTTYTDAKSAEEAKILEQIKKGKIRQTRGSGAVAGKFFGVNAGRIEHLIEATKADFGRGEWAILRQANDQYRKIIFNAQMYSATGATYEQAVDMATKDFLKAGIQSITYKNGARHTMADYSRMALKTGQKRAYLMGEGDVHDKYGIHTVRVNKRVDACPLCVKWLGKVLVDDVYAGGTAEEAQKAGVPLLSEAIDEGFLHPNCKDVYSMYIEGVSTPADPWSKDELKDIADKYNAEQALQRAEDMQASYQRMADNSLDKMNVQRYQARADAWGARADELRGGIPPAPVGASSEMTEAQWMESNIQKAKDFDAWLDSDVTEAFEVDGNIFEKLPLKEVQEYLKAKNGYYTYGEIPPDETWAIMYKDGTSVVLGEGDSLNGIKRNNILYAVNENESTTMIYGKSKDIGIFNQSEFDEGFNIWRVGAKYQDDKLLQFVGDYFETAETETKLTPITEQIAKENVADKSKAYQGFIADANTNHVKYETVKPMNAIQTDDDIIAKISGGDKTSGSCASLAWAYVGNMRGYDVRDFRGGASCEWCRSNYFRMPKLDGVVTKEAVEFNAVKGATRLLNEMEEGKTYILWAGKHASVVRKNNGVAEWLELQSANNSGWHSFTPKTLQRRFGCTKQRTSYGIKMKQSSRMFDVSSLMGNEEFENLLGYINTPLGKEKKGVGGSVK